MQEGDAEDLTPAAKAVLDVAGHTAAFSTGVGLSRAAFLRDLLGLAGVQGIDRIDIFACGWPTDMALEIAHTFFRQDGALMRLRFEHLESEASALRAFEIVRVALFELSGRYILPRHHDHALRFASVLQGSDFEDLHRTVRVDLRSRVDRTSWSIAAYLVRVYVRTLLKDNAVAQYLPSSAYTEAVCRVAAVVDQGVARLFACAEGCA